MNQKKIEMHAHTRETSSCGKLPAQKLIKMCYENGYDAVVITDHLWTGWHSELPLAQRVDRYLRGYRAAKEAQSRYPVTVLLGMEARVDSGYEDFLIFGLKESDIPEILRAIDTMHTIEELSHWVHQRDRLIVQAHPFRPGLRQMPYEYLDGIEVVNGNPRQENRNELALEYAQRGGMLMTSGSDAHQREDINRGGMFAPDWVVDEASLVRYLNELKADESKGAHALYQGF